AAALIVLVHLPLALPALSSTAAGAALDAVAKVLRLRQAWTMFHTVQPNTMWPLLVGRTADGRMRRLPDGVALDAPRTRDELSASYPSHRYKKEQLALVLGGRYRDVALRRIAAAACAGGAGGERLV